MKDISNKIFFLVFTSSENVPRTLRPGYDPNTGKCDEKSENILNSEKVAHMQIAKNIVQNIPREQNDETLGDYCDYFLRLLWIRENWLRSPKSTRRSFGLGRKETVVEGYTDIHEDDTFSLFGAALHRFCKISIRQDFRNQVISFALEMKYVQCSHPQWSNGVQTFYRLSPLGKQAAEESDERLLQLIKNHDTEKEHPEVEFKAELKVALLGRKPKLRSLWAVKQFENGLAENDICQKWATMTYGERKTIDPGNTGEFSKEAIRKAIERATTK